MLTITNLTKHFSVNKTVFPVLSEITTTIHDGEFVMIMGESGSGKSTFLNCISTLDKPTSGQVMLDDQDILGLSSEQIQAIRLNAFGFIFQENHMIETLTMIENIMISRLQIDADAKEKALDLMRQLKVDHIADKHPYQISGGERQRCAIARALINNPKVLFADEPTASLNPLYAFEIMSILQDLNQQGQTIVMVTHSIKMASFGTRLLLLSNGNFSVDQDLKNLSSSAKTDKIVELVVDVI